MNRTIRILVATASLLGVGLFLLGCTAHAESQGVYYCPMHPGVTADRASDCPICGMHLVLPAAPQPASRGGADPGHFVCPMHPEITSEKPADCSLCGMHLVREALPAAPGPAGLAPVSLDAGARERLGITVGEVGTRSLEKTLKASGRIVADETRIFRIIARVEGFVDQLFIPYAGRSVRKDQPLLGIYSLNIVSAQQQFLNGYPSEGRRFAAPSTRPTGPSPEPVEKGEDIQRQRLKYWDFSDEQINRIQETGKTENSLILVAPSSGWVTEKNALVGQKVFPGDLLMVVTDLSRVWAEAEVSEMDAPVVRVGMPMEIRPASMPGRAFRGKVKFFQPLLDPQSHTMKVVVELPNPDGELKPGMLGTAELRCGVRECLAVPEGAVLRSGETAYAFVEQGGRLVPRTVVLGDRADGFYEVTSGLRLGERVVTSASFLLDSESSLQAALKAAGDRR